MHKSKKGLPIKTQLAFLDFLDTRLPPYLGGIGEKYMNILNSLLISICIKTTATESKD